MISTRYLGWPSMSKREVTDRCWMSNQLPYSSNAQNTSDINAVIQLVNTRNLKSENDTDITQRMILNIRYTLWCKQNFLKIY